MNEPIDLEIKEIVINEYDIHTEDNKFFGEVEIIRNKGHNISISIKTILDIMSVNQLERLKNSIDYNIELHKEKLNRIKNNSCGD